MGYLLSKGRVLAAAGALTAMTLGVSFAFTASNTVPDSKAGEGSGAVSGYTVSNIHYNLNATTSSNVDSVTFNVDTAPPAGATLKAQFVSSGGAFYDCTSTGTAVTCNTTGPQLTVLPIDTVHVILAQ